MREKTVRDSGRSAGRRCAVVRIGTVMVAALLVSLATSTRAQNTGDLETGHEASGVPVGTLRVFPRLTFENYYDDNIFASKADVGDYVASIIPRLGVETTWPRHYVSLGVAGRFTRYAGETAEDSDEYAIDVKGRLDLTTGSTLGASFGQGRQTLGRANSENTGRTDPQQVDVFEGRLVYEQDFSRFALELQGFVDRFDFVDGLDDDRDRLDLGGSMRLQRRFSPAFALFIEPSLEARNYDENVDDTGLERGSVAVVGLVGAEFDITSVIRGEVGIGPVYVGFDESGFDDLLRPAVLGEASWDITRLTRLKAEVEHLVLPTDVRGASSKTRTLASVEIRHELLRNLILEADTRYFREEFNELRRTDDNVWLRVGAEYVVNRFFSVAARYRYGLRDSDFRTREFHQNIVMLSLEAKL